MNRINKILIANRGEIAVRIIKTAKRMGIKTVCLYSDIDRHALHVILADEAYHLEGSSLKDTYLNIDQILEFAKISKADAIHPGYGFLSENSGFARKIKEANLIFIGPSEHSIEIMGNKIAAKEAVVPFNVPLVPGVDRAILDVKEGKEIAAEIGYPVLIKAAAGGGGKGMRIVNQKEDFEELFERAVSEATSSFGNGSVFIEKYIVDPKHIEVQILADNHGNVIHLFERECSIQRRHQKVIEEAPSPSISSTIRAKLGLTAIKVAKSCGYSGAGTVEFIVDQSKKFYFLEMNTRLQVEHPVTEEITGIDLVEQQIKIAEGKKLAFDQKDLSIKQHAIELRVYAEDPSHNFLPSPGVLRTYKLPQTPKTRVDHGVVEGSEISIHYDPMISKLICVGATRSECIENLKRAIDDYKIEGVKNTLEFGKFVLNHPAFIDGTFTTHFVNKYFNKTSLVNIEKEKIGGIIASYLYHQKLNEVKLPN